MDRPSSTPGEAPELDVRLGRAYELGADADPQLRPLVEETYDLVERHVPGVDVERLRRIFRYERPLWDAESIEPRLHGIPST